MEPAKPNSENRIKTAYPTRTLRVTGPNLDAKCRWEQKYGNWFCISAEKPLQFMVFPYAFTEPRLAELKRRGLQYQWLE